MFHFRRGLLAFLVILLCQGCGSIDGVAVVDAPTGDTKSNATLPPAPRQLQSTTRVSRRPEAESPRNRPDIREPKIDPTLAIKAPGDLGPVWNVERDEPTPAYSIKEDLEYLWPVLNSRVAPVLACLRGPFGLKPDVKLSDRVYWSIDKENPSPIDVIDLRTGETTGKFSHKIPMEWVSRLSPDGKVLVGPTNDDPRNLQEAQARTLVVWNAGDDESKIRFVHAKGSMLWFGFVGRREVAVLTRSMMFSNNVQTAIDCVEFFNVETGALRTKLEMLYECPTYLQPGIDGNPSMRTWISDVVAVSPRGKYLAIVGPERLMLVDRATAELKGTFAMPSLSGNRATVRFSDDASRIFVTALGTYPWFSFTGSHFHIFEINAVDGSCVSQREVLGPSLKRFHSSDSVDLRWYDGNPQWVSPEAIVMSGFGERSGASQASVAKAIFPDSRVATMLDFPELVRMLDTGPALVVKMERVVSREKYSVVAVDRDSILDLSSSKANSFGDLGNPRLLLTGFPSSVVADEPMNDEKWVAVPAASSSLACNLKDHPDEPTWLFRGTQKSGYVNEGARSLAWQSIDPETTERIGTPLGLLTWDEGAIKNQVTGATVLAISPSGERLAFIDPMRNDSLYIVSSDGSKSVMFHSSFRAIDWCGFLDNDKMMLAGNGCLTRCELGDVHVDFNYVTDKRNYQHFAMHPERKCVAASRTGGIDMVDVASGKCINRMMLGEKSSVKSLSFSPTGKYLAAACKEPTDAHYAKELYVWDMETGAQLKGSLDASTLAWVGPDLLLVGGPSNSVLCDLKLGDSFLSFGLSEVGGQNALRVSRLATSLQGGVWGNVEGQGGWKLLSASVGSQPSEIPFFASDRKIVDLGNTPIAIEMHLGKVAVGKKHGKRIATDLQQRGYKIGKGGYTLRVKTSESVSQSQIRVKKGGSSMQLLIPRVNYRWTLEDENRKVIWNGTTAGDFDSKRSRYLVGGAAQGTEFNFGSQDMSQAIVSEILEQGNGLEVPKDIPTKLVVGGGAASVIPQKLPWATVDASP